MYAIRSYYARKTFKAEIDMAFIEISGLKKRYAGEADCVEALKGVDLSVEEGSFIGVMGPSGSGKSTLLSILGGLCQPRITSYNVCYTKLLR